MPKFFVANNQIKDNIIEIIGDDVNHIVNVLRLSKKDEITITDKEYNVSYNSEIEELSKESVICKILNKIEDTTEINIDVTIFQGIPKAEKMEYIIQKTTELGVKRIIPVSMRRCIVKLEGKDEKKKIERWQKIAEVAAKQSGRDVIPKIENVLNVKEVVDKIKESEVFLIAYENEKETSLKEVLKNNKNIKRISILVGPEGGLEENEIEILKQAGAKTITLGKRILRTETAPIAMLSNIIYEYEL